MKTIVFCILIVFTIASTAYGQTLTYTASVNSSSGQNYSVNVEIVLTDIIPAQSSCDWGYNYDVAYDYDIQIVGGSSSLYTLAGYLTCGSNQGIYFNLPNNGGSGSSVTQGNPWNSNSDCATATVESLMCNSIELEIEGPGIPIQTLTLEPTGGNGDDSEWDTNGNSCDTTAFIGTVNEADLRFRTNNIERMRLTDDGKFGIGITDPLEKLELQGNFKLSGDVIFSDYGGDTLDRFLFVDENGRTKTKGLKFLFDAIYRPINCEEVTDLNGNVVDPTWQNGLNKIYNGCPINVGIGTQNPGHSLDVRGQIRGTRNIFLGIPVATPSEQFEDLARVHVINANSLAPNNKGDFIRFDDYSQSHGGNKLATVFKVDDKGGVHLDYLGQDKALDISSKSEDRKLLQLYNNGLLRAREIKVDEAAWPDYVFQPDYELMPLNKVKEFIAQNGHLPNVPSAEEIEADGVNLGETARVTMEKVEELTLYLIEQQEQLEDQQDQLEQQKELLNQQQELIQAQQELVEKQQQEIGALKVK